MKKNISESNILVKMSIPQSILTLLFIMTAFFSQAQKQHLDPVEERSNEASPLKEYYDNVFPLLYREFSETPIARFTSLPSFSSEHSFSVETINNKYYIISNSLSESYWYAAKKEKVRLITHRAEIDSALAFEIGMLFQMLLEQTRKPEKGMFGLDGTTYYFSAVDKNGIIKSGQTWSPDDDTLLGRLVTICDSLYQIGSGKAIGQKHLVTQIEDIIEILRK